MQNLYGQLYKEAGKKLDDFVKFYIPNHFEGYIQKVMEELDTYWENNFPGYHASIDLKEDRAPLLSAAVEKIKETNETVEKLIHGMHLNRLYLRLQV